jgi:excinuclease UvrABC helicase subunit UvrB
MKEFIINPEKLKIISESNKKRASNASRIVKRKIEIEKQIEVHSNAIERARNLYEGSAYTEKEWLMKDKQARENIKELEAELKKVLKEELKSNDIIKYQKILQYINSMTEESIDNIFKNHENAKTLISYIINEIIVYSRPATEGDKIQGRPKQN